MTTAQVHAGAVQKNDDTTTDEAPDARPVEAVSPDEAKDESAAGTVRMLEQSAEAMATRSRELKDKTQEALSEWVDETAQKWGQYALTQLFSRKGRVSRTMNQVPDNMHRVANQTQLVLELIDDFQTGTYREIPWRSIALLSFALLYAVSPADLVPDALPLVGQLDDLSIIALATRATNADLRAYCRFKGYDESEFFRAQKEAA